MVRHCAVLEFDSWSRDGAVVVAPRGVLDVRTAARLRNHLAKLAADQPRAVVVDLAGLRLASPSAVSVFARAHSELAEWPGVPVVLAVPPGLSADLLTRQRLDRFVPVRCSVADALAAVEEPPPRLVDRVLLLNAPASTDIARRFATDSCVVWGHPELAEDAAALLGELVANTVTHTRSVCRVRVELRRGLLSVAAYDDDPRPPCPGDTGGLAVVARTAAAWGCSPTLSGGKVVWATLRTRDQPRRAAEEYSASRGERP